MRVTTQLKDPSAVERRRDDFRIEFFRASGAGGQNRNKRDTACRITDLRTGMASEATEHRTQRANRDAAFKRLARRIIEKAVEAERDPLARAALGEFGDADRIRTYNFPRKTVKDHRNGIVAPLREVLNGRLELLR